jgi:hypothetical protein
MCPAERGGVPGEMTRGGLLLPGDGPSCVCCGYAVPERPPGCRWPCANCGFLYPQGDCSD